MCALFVMSCWSVATVLWLMDSVRNLNALSIAANMMATLGGLQAGLAMRKADDKDDY